MAINWDALDLQADLDQQLDRLTDTHTRELVAAWASAWSETAPDLQAALTDLLADAEDGFVSADTMARSQRLASILTRIHAALQKLIGLAAATLTGDLPRILRAAAAVQTQIIAAQLPNVDDRPMPDLDPDGFDDLPALDAIVERTTEKITSLLDPIPEDVSDLIDRELIRGVSVGDNPRLVAARMVKRAEAKHVGALGLSRALTIARTEIIDAHRAAAQAGQDEHADVLAGWVWLAHLGPRTCQACVGMHGRVFGLEVPGPEGHQQCRCARMPKTKSWADLGIDMDEPEDQAADADDWFEALPVADQKAILGKNYDAWAAGDFPRDQWVKRRSNEGWRDSHVPAKPGGEHTTDGAGSNPPGSPDSQSRAGDPDEYPLISDGTRVPFKRSERPNILDPDSEWAAQMRTHILDGDARGGGHMLNADATKRTRFPEAWTRLQALEGLDHTLQDPALIERLTSAFQFYGEKDGVRMVVRIGIESLEWVSGYPIEGPGVTFGPNAAGEWSDRTKYPTGRYDHVPWPT